MIFSFFTSNKLQVRLLPLMIPEHKSSSFIVNTLDFPVDRLRKGYEKIAQKGLAVIIEYYDEKTNKFNLRSG